MTATPPGDTLAARLRAEDGTHELALQGLPSMTTANNDHCRVCGGHSRFVFRQRLLTHEVSYFDCTRCGYVQTETPYWLEAAYASAINDVDTGILWRNQVNVQRVIMTLRSLGRLDGTVVDHAGGYGILVRLLRDVGIEALWRDKYCDNLLAKGFEADDRPADLITAFEVFEHLEDPLAELRTLLQHAPALLISTELCPSESPPSPDWWYLGPEHGQHIGFFRKRTLQFMARQVGCNVASHGSSLHLFTRQAIPASWRLLQTRPKYARIVARLGGLRSKTMSDFNALRARAQ